MNTIAQHIFDSAALMARVQRGDFTTRNGEIVSAIRKALPGAHGDSHYTASGCVTYVTWHDGKRYAIHVQEVRS